MALATDSREQGIGQPVLSHTLSNDRIAALGQRLTDEDVVKLRFLSFEWIGRKDWPSITSFPLLVSRLRDEIKTEDDFCAVITELLYIIQRYDLLKVLGSCRHTAQSQNRKLVSRYWKHWYDLVEKIEVDNMVSMHVELLEALKKETRPGNLEDLLGPLQDLLGEQSSILNDWLRTKVFEVPGAEDIYEIRKVGTYGLCIIINNKIFDDDAQCRHGTDIDRDALECLFESFDFKVETSNDLKGTEIKKYIMDVAERNLTQYDCFACCILSHGSEGVVQGVDTNDKTNCDVKIQEEIIQPFCKTAKTLIGKPKLFFIHACQGTKNQGIVELPRKKEPEESFQTDNLVRPQYPTAPGICDYLLYMPTIVGYVAFRHKKKGTWYVKALQAELDTFGSKEDILSVLTKANNYVAAAIANMKCEEFVEGRSSKIKCGQTAEVHHTLTKKLYLRKKRLPHEA